MASSLTNTGNPPYTTARVDYLARYLQSQLPGLDYDLAVKWINAERGANGNTLGVTYRDASGQHLYRYASQEEGIRQAAALVKRSGNYSGIRASLGGSYLAQAQALVASPWNARNSAYYARLFGVTIPIGGFPTGWGGGGITGDVGTGTPISAPSITTLDKLLGLPAGTKIDATTAKMLQDRVKALQADGTISTETAQNLFTTIGDRGVASSHGVTSTLGQVSVEIGSGKVPLPKELQGVADALGLAGATLAFLTDVENWKYLAALGVGIPLTLLGFYLLAGVPTGGRNA